MNFAGIKVPELIHESSSKYNKKIQVYKIEDRYRLVVNNIVQSISVNTPSVTRRVWGKVVQTVKENKPQALTALLLGLGGATMPHLFKKEMPQLKVTAIEIDEEMIDVAKRYFDLDSLTNLSVIKADALRVLTHPEEYNLEDNFFDVVIVDIYCGGKYPDLGKSGSFFAGVKNLVKPGGLVLFNRIYVESAQNETDQFCELAENFFENIHKTPVAGRTNSDNILIYGEAK